MMTEIYLQICYHPLMDKELMLRRKWTFRAHDKQIVLVKKRNERSAHVFMKALIWALYLPCFSNLTVEVEIGGRYKPDVVSLDSGGHPRFWGEAGHIAKSKLQNLLKKYRSTQFAIAKWGSSLEPFEEIIHDALKRTNRDRPVDLIRFPEDSVNRFIQGDGTINVSHYNLDWSRF